MHVHYARNEKGSMLDMDFTDFEPSPRELEVIKSLLISMAPEVDTHDPKPERFEITGDVFEGNLPLDPNKKKQENDEDKYDEPTKH